jgi:hypothetical protein
MRESATTTFEGRSHIWVVNTIPYLIGLGGFLGLLGFYIGIMTLTADWYYAQIQFGQYRWWILGLATGFGTQVTLFFIIRRRLRILEKRAATSTVAASGGLSTASMIACCLHHLTDILPVMGLPVVAMTLQKYQPVFFLVGVLSNLFGIGFMLRMMNRHEIIHIDSIRRSFSVRFHRSNQP